MDRNERKVKEYRAIAKVNTYVGSDLLSTVSEERATAVDVDVVKTSNTVDYWNRKKAGLIIPSRELVREHTKIVYPQGLLVDKTHAMGPVDYEGRWFVLPDVDFYDFNEAYGRVKADVDARLLEKIQDVKLDLGVFLATLNQTASMFADVAGSLARSIFAMKKGQFAKGFGLIRDCSARHGRTFKGPKLGKGLSVADLGSTHVQKQLAGLRLQWSYGVAPLLSDIKGGCEKLVDTQYGRPKAEVKTKVGRTFSDSKDVSLGAFPGEPGDPQLTAQRQAKLTVRGNLRFGVREGEYLLNSLGLTNPWLIMWEVVPFSFVIDWALPVGTWLGNIGATYGTIFQDGCYVCEWEARNFSACDFKGEGWDVQVQGYRERKGIYVIPMADFPPNPFPTFENPFSPGRVLNAVALLRALKK